MSTVKAQISAYRNTKERIKYDSDLTQQGKTKQLEALKKEMEKGRAAAITELRAEWNAIRTRGKSLEQRKTKAMDEQSKQWDYSRLAFEVGRARAMVEGAAVAANPMAGVTVTGYLKQQYKAAANSGDKFKARAFAEMADVIAAKYQREPDAVTFARQLRADLTRMVTTPELKAIEAEGQELVRRAQEAADATETAKAFYGAELDDPAKYAEFKARMNGSSWGQQSAAPAHEKPESFESLMSGISVRQVYRTPQTPEEEAAGMTPGFATSLEIAD